MSTTRTTGKAKGDAKHAAHSKTNPAPEAGMSRDVINIGGNIAKRAISSYLEHEIIDEHGANLLEWVWGYAFDVLGGSRDALCKSLGYSWTVIWRVYTGNPESGLGNFLEACEHLQRKAARQQATLVETIVTRRIEEALCYARDFNVMVSITGPTGRSKTFTARHWARRNNHGRARYLRIPSGCTRRTLVLHLCKLCGIGVNGQKTGNLEQRLFKAFDQRNTLIIDEAGHLMPRSGTGTSAIEFLRDLNDMCGCGVALIFTDVYLQEMRQGRLRDYFEQFIGRIQYEVDIPAMVLKDETKEVVGHFREEPPTDLLAFAHKTANGRDGKLRTLFEDLQRASEFAEAQHRPVTRTDLKTAVEWRNSGGLWPAE